MITWSYIAGFLDGDGWISKSYIKSGNKVKRPRYFAAVTQVVTQKIHMEQIHAFLISKNIKATITIRKKNWKSNLMMVNVGVKHQESLVKFLQKIYPHLLIKKNLANEAILYLSNHVKTRKLKPMLSKNKRVWTNKEKELLIELVRLGLSNIEISHKLKRGTHAIANKVSRWKINRRE